MEILLITCWVCEISGLFTTPLLSVNHSGLWAQLTQSVSDCSTTVGSLYYYLLAARSRVSVQPPVLSSPAIEHGHTNFKAYN